jgi:release factor glutamine methyltransferase
VKRSEAEFKFSEELKAVGVDEPALEARLYLKAIEVGDVLTPEQILKFAEYCKRRILGEPAAYILGKKGFYKWDFWVQPGVLIPRPETEHVIEVALKLVNPPPKNLADLGCGSGVIGISLAKEWNVPVTCVDFSPIAVEITQRNAHALGASELVSVVKSPVVGFLPRQTFDLVVANPPYIADGDPDVESNVHKYEPSEALYAGPRGTEKIHEWSRWALKFLNQNGWWIFEFGAGQRPSIEVILLEVGFVNVQFTSDLAGIERVCACQKP